jgi:hypothetical protein
VRHGVDGKREVLWLAPGLLDPSLQSVTGGPRDLELHRALGLVLHDEGAASYLIPMAHVPNLEGDKVASAQLAVDALVEECEFSHSMLHLEMHSQRPDVLYLEGCLLPDDPRPCSAARDERCCLRFP